MVQLIESDTKVCKTLINCALLTIVDGGHDVGFAKPISDAYRMLFSKLYEDNSLNDTDLAILNSLIDGQLATINASMSAIKEANTTGVKYPHELMAAYEQYKSLYLGVSSRIIALMTKEKSF
jgi:hypothetical protein